MRRALDWPRHFGKGHYSKQSRAWARLRPPPESHFGFATGTDEKLARWDGVLEYFEIFSFRSLSNEDVRDPDFLSRLDVIMIPSEIPLDRLVEGHDEQDVPAEYAGGIGDADPRDVSAALERLLQRGTPRGLGDLCASVIGLRRSEASSQLHFGEPDPRGATLGAALNAL